MADFLFFLLKWDKSDENGEHKAQEREAPDIQGTGPYMVPDRYIRHARSQQQGCRHGANERGAKSQDLHGNCDGQGFQTEGLSDTEHDGQHSVEIAVCIKKQGQRHSQCAEQQVQMLSQ